MTVMRLKNKMDVIWDYQPDGVIGGNRRTGSLGGFRRLASALDEKHGS